MLSFRIFTQETLLSDFWPGGECHANDKSASFPVSYGRRVTSRTEITCLEDAIKSQRTHTEYRSPIGANDIGRNPASGHAKRSQPIRGLQGRQSGTSQRHHSKVI